MATKKVIVAFTLGGSAGRAGHDIGTASMRHFQSASACQQEGKPIAASGTSGQSERRSSHGNTQLH